MTTDPRIMKQMLLTQWMSEINPLNASSTDSTGESSGLFDMLLNQYMSSSFEEESTAAVSKVSAGWNTGALARMYGLSGSLTADSGSTSAFDDLIASAAAKFGVDPALIKGVIQSESSFHPNAVSSAGAKGLMQLMDGTARGLGVTDPFDPAQNIEGGTRFLSYLLRKYDGNVSSALAAYNAGPGRIDRLGLTTDELIASRLQELPEETQKYIGKVLEAARQWSSSI